MSSTSILNVLGVFPFVGLVDLDQGRVVLLWPRCQARMQVFVGSASCEPVRGRGMCSKLYSASPVTPLVAAGMNGFSQATATMLQLIVLVVGHVFFYLQSSNLIPSVGIADIKPYDERSLNPRTFDDETFYYRRTYDHLKRRITVSPNSFHCS